MIRGLISEWLERRTPRLLRITLLSLPSSRDECVRVRYTLSGSVLDTAVFFDPASGTHAEVDGGSFAAVVRAAGFWQVRFADDGRDRFVDFVCRWPLTSDEFRVWADVPCLGLRKVGAREIPELELPNVESDQGCAYVSAASTPRRLVAATFTRGSSAAKTIHLSPDQSHTRVRLSDISESRPVIEAYDAMTRSLSRAVRARVLLSGRVSLAQADFASIGVAHRVPPTLLNEANPNACALLTRWELSSLWWGGMVQPLDRGADQLIHALRIATAFCSGSADDDAERLFFRHLESGSSEQWARWLRPCLNDAKALLASHRPDALGRLRSLYRAFESRRVSERSLRRALHSA